MSMQETLGTESKWNAAATAVFSLGGGVEKRRDRKQVMFGAELLNSNFLRSCHKECQPYREDTNTEKASC